MAQKRIERSDLIAPDAITSAVKELEVLKKSLIDVLNVQKDLIKNNSFKDGSDVKKFMADVEKVNSTTKALNQTRKEEDKLKKQLRASTDEEVKAKLRLQKANKAQKDELKDLLVLEDRETGTLERLAAQNRKLRRERQGLNLETQKGRKRLQEINSVLDQNNARIKTNSDALKKQRLSVGAYASGVQEGIAATGLFSRQLIILQRIQAAVTLLTRQQAKATATLAQTQTAAAASTGLLSKALRILKIAFISTGIGAIVVALGTLTAAFFSTQRGADALTRFITPLRVVFERFVGFLQNTAFSVLDKVKAAFDDPAESAKELGKAIVTNILNRFKALILLGQSLGKVLEGIFDRDTDKISEGLKESAEAIATIATGTEDSLNKALGFAKGINEETEKSLALGKELASLEIELEKIRIRNTVPLKEAELAYREAYAQAQLLEKSDVNRTNLVLEAKRQLEIANNLRKQELEAELRIAELKASFNDTDRDTQLEIEQIKARIIDSDAAFQKKLGTLNAQLKGAQTEEEESAKRVLETREKIAKIQSDQVQTVGDSAAERDKKETEEFIANTRKKAESAKKSEEERIQAEEEAAEKRKELQEENVKSIEDSVTAVSDTLNIVSERRINNIEKEEERVEKSIDVQQRRAEQGLTNTLALEQEKAAQLEQQREEEAKKQERRQKVTAYLTAFTEFLKDNPNTAAGKALAQVAIAESISGLFFDGAENINDKTANRWRNTGKDDFLIGVHGGERVLTSHQNMRIGGMSNDDLADLAYHYQRGSLGGSRFDDRRITKGLSRVESAIVSNSQQIDVNKLGEVIDVRIEKGMKRKTTYKNTNGGKI